MSTHVLGRMPLILVALAASSPMGCSNAPDSPPDTSTASDQQSDALELTSSTPVRIAGSFRHDAVVLQFESAIEGTTSSLAVMDSAGAEIVRIANTPSGTEMWVLGKYHHRLDASTLAALRSGDGVQSGAMTPKVEFEGDPAALQDLEARPEYATLPLLSRALGAKGINGKAYPSSLGLHLFAKRAARVGKLALPDQRESSAQAPGLHPQGLPPGVLSCFLSGSNTCCRTTPTSPLVCRPLPLPAACPYTYPDLRCDPNNDKCFGMCGDDCDCWESVCGDCQYHWQCAQHDWVCQQGETLPFWNPAKYAFVASCYSWDAAAAGLTCLPGPH